MVSPWLALIAALAFALVGSSHAQISPGPLSSAHHTLDGASGCTSCHAVGSGAAKFRCLDCHKEIASRIVSHRGFHATAVAASAGGEACVRCHSEHNGRDFPILKWNPKQFDHSKAGFNLTGKHASVECAKCHKPENITASERTALASTNLSKTYLGLSQACATCHQDKHQGRLGQECQKCHTTSDWKAQGSFDHAKTRYPLTGLHSRVTCQKCHTMPDNTVKYVGLSFSDCSSCHSDPHKGYFKQQTCQNCHTTMAWKTSATDAKFDHTKTPYPLLGKHGEVKCERCHARVDFARKVVFDQCASCHKPDPHKGQFANRADGGRCESCHTVNGFKQATFTVVDHRKTAYPLEGKHNDVACAKCHVPAGKDTQFRIKFASCTDCHKDIHRAQFSGAPYFNKCESCHSVAGFHPGTFTMNRHEQTRFRLTGGHVAVACFECHKKGADDSPASYHFAGLDCTTCHSDPHRGQFASRMNSGVSGTRGCEVCHSTSQWSDLAAFNHSTTRFELTGAHRATQCSSCHRPQNLELTMRNVDFRSASQQCEQCHEDPHDRQFVGVDNVTRCAQCHNTAKWRPSFFNHAKTRFPLDGAHKDVPCARCHKDYRLVAERKILFYRPTPTTCTSCHGNKPEAAGKS